MFDICSFMYLDDLIILSPDRQSADMNYDTARSLLEELGPPEAKEKAQPPTQRIKWLGIVIDSNEMSLSIPQDKVDDILEQVRQTHQKHYITKRQLQSLLGLLLFVAKCVRPARASVSHMLAAMREAKNDRIIINEDFRADLSWFMEFCSEWNGIGIIPTREPAKVLVVDACLFGVGATDVQFAYGAQISQVEDGVNNITELEAINVVLAIHTLIGEADRGTHIRVRCDNMAAVQVFTSGQAANKVLQDCARATWMTQALLSIELSYDHIPGKDNDVADALSRAHHAFSLWKV